VISTPKRQGNRTNARASTGPRSAAGKARVAQNARRHGLRVPVLSDPKLSAEVEALAREIAGEQANSELKELARRVAEAQIDVIRVRRARHETIADALGDPHFELSRGAKMKLEVAAQFARSHGVRAPMPDDLLSSSPQGPNKFATILSDLSQRLAAMDRYERRALSRRKFAVRDFDSYKLRNDTQQL
jgi:hypothetical protein